MLSYGRREKFGLGVLCASASRIGHYGAIQMLYYYYYYYSCTERTFQEKTLNHVTRSTPLLRVICHPDAGT